MIKLLFPRKRTFGYCSLFLLSAALTIAALPDLAQLKLAAEAGDAVAQYDYGRRISLTNHNEQFGWFLKSAQQGYAPAQDAVADHLASEASFQPKLRSSLQRQSVLWASRAAFQGHASAQAKLASAYERGTALIKDPVAAYMWIQIAVQTSGGDKGNLKGFFYKTERDRMIANITSAQVAEGQRLAAGFDVARYHNRMNPVEADLIFGQLKLTAIFQRDGQNIATINNALFAANENKEIVLDDNKVLLNCLAVDAKSVRLGIAGTGFVKILQLNR